MTLDLMRTYMGTPVLVICRNRSYQGTLLSISNSAISMGSVRVAASDGSSANMAYNVCIATNHIEAWTSAADKLSADEK